MSTIGFGMLPQEGHHYPTLRLAYALKARGHRVCYFGVPDFEGWVTARGFEFVPVFEEVYPRGSRERERALAPAAREAAMRDMFQAYSQYLLGDALDARLASASLDLMLVDTLSYFVVMAARAQGISCLRLSTSLPQSAAPGIPPLSSSLPFGDTPARAAAAEQAWTELVQRRAESDAHTQMALLGALQAKYDYPDGWINHRATFEPDLFTVPELVLCSPALDFPRAAEPSRHHIESISLERPQVPFPWEEMDESKPCIYCSLGTEAHRVASSRRFYAEVLAAAARLPGYQFVLAVGTWLRAADFDEVPDNVVLVSYAPQLALLPRAHLVITHGGLGTLKESLFFGKPVLVFPGVFDQHGNAARIAYHRLGLVGNHDTVTADALVDMIRTAQDDPGLSRRLAIARAALVELEESQPGLALVERALARG